MKASIILHTMTTGAHFPDAETYTFICSISRAIIPVYVFSLYRLSAPRTPGLPPPAHIAEWLPRHPL